MIKEGPSNLPGMSEENIFPLLIPNYLIMRIVDGDITTMVFSKEDIREAYNLYKNDYDIFITRKQRAYGFNKGSLCIRSNEPHSIELSKEFMDRKIQRDNKKNKQLI